jgi:hypothetical protein
MTSSSAHAYSNICPGLQEQLPPLGTQRERARSQLVPEGQPSPHAIVQRDSPPIDAQRASIKEPQSSALAQGRHRRSSMRAQWPSRVSRWPAAQRSATQRGSSSTKRQCTSRSLSGRGVQALLQAPQCSSVR